MPATTCPSHDELLAYTLGRLSDAASDDVAVHLGSCPDCKAELASTDAAEDTFVAQLRRPAPGDPYLAEPQCRLAVARALAVLDRHFSPNERSSRSLCGKTLGDYQLVEQLGHGGMGTVYKALHTKLDRVVAIKVLTLGRAHDPRAIARFEREMKAIGKLDDRHIVRAYDAREIDGTPLLVMEYTEGLDLREIVGRVGPLDTDDACELARQAALGLQYVHEHGLVHRDVKPSNLMLNSQGEVKILDLGLARFHWDQPWDEETAGSSQTVGGEMTGSDQAMGTADYMAPEQVSNSRDVDIRTDIYGLGCTLYKLLSGRAPFSGPEHDGPCEKMAAHTSESVPPIRQFRPDIPDGLAAVLDRMLAKSPEARYSTPAEVAEALAPWCSSADLVALLRQATGAEAPVPGEDRRSRPVGATQTTREPLLASWGRKWIVTMLGLLLIGGLGFALQIIIHIKKGDQEATVELPTGSSVRIGADGQVNVELPEAGHAIAPVTPENAAASAATIQQSKAQDRQRAKAQARMRKDADTYSPEELQEIDSMFEAGSRSAKWRTEGGRKSLKALVEKYKKANRTGCAVLYLGQGGKGNEQIAYLRQAMTDYGDCFFDSGVQIGAIARLYLGMVYLRSGKVDEAEKAMKLFDEIRKDYPDSIDGYGNSLIAELARYESPQWIKALERMRKDAETYSPEELREIELLYSVLYQKPQIEENVRDALKVLVRKYPKANRTGCALLPLSLMSRGDEQLAYLKQAIADHGDCFYGDGVQVGAYARFYLGQTYLRSGKPDKAKKLFDEIRKEYPDAIDHQGRSLVAQLATVAQQVRIGKQMQKSEAASVRRQAVESTTSGAVSTPGGRARD